VPVGQRGQHKNIMGVDEHGGRLLSTRCTFQRTVEVHFDEQRMQLMQDQHWNRKTRQSRPRSTVETNKEFVGIDAAGTVSGSTSGDSGGAAEGDGKRTEDDA
jgi:hypothetical protein